MDADRFQALSNALYLTGAPTVVAFTGSGGKTTCSEELARAAASAGRRVVLTTTTKIRIPASHLDAEHTEAVRLALKGARGPTFLGRLAPDGKKLLGPPPELLEAIIEEEVADLVVIEADGSRGASLKAYRAGEPVLPTRVDRCCVLVGIDVLGARKDSPQIHRPEILWPLLGLSDEARLGPPDVVRALSEQPGYLGHAKRFPTSIVVNKVDQAVDLDRVQELLSALTPLLDRSGVVRVLARGRAVAPGGHPGVACVWQRVRRDVHAVLLAAGTSTRFGGLKQIADVDGQPMVVRAARSVLAAPVASLTVVVGHEADAVRGALTSHIGDARLRLVYNPRYAEGLSTSVATAAAAIQDGDGILIALADMPHIACSTVVGLLDEFRGCPFGIVAPVHDGRRGHPVLLDRRYLPALRGLSGGGRGRSDVGAAPVLRRHATDVLLVPVEDRGVLLDVDEAVPSAAP